MHTKRFSGDMALDFECEGFQVKQVNRLVADYQSREIRMGHAAFLCCESVALA